MNPKLAWILAIISAFIFFLLLTLVIYYLVSSSEDDDEPVTSAVSQKDARNLVGLPDGLPARILHPKHKKNPTTIKKKKPKQ